MRYLGVVVHFTVLRMIQSIKPAGHLFLYIKQLSQTTKRFSFRTGIGICLKVYSDSDFFSSLEVHLLRISERIIVELSCDSLYRKNPTNSDPRKINVIILSFYYRVMGPKGAKGIANSVDPEQTAPLGAVWSGFTMFAQVLGTLRYWNEVPGDCILLK